MLSHSVRPTAFAPERTWTLEPDALVWRDTRGRGRVPYRDITAIRLVRTPWPPTAGFLQANVDTAGAGRVVIRGSHYAGIGRIEDRRATYGPLVRDLVGRVAAANPAVRLVAGHARFYRLLWIAIAAIGGLVVGASILALLFGDIAPTAPIIALAVAMPMALQVMRGGKARAFTADAIPAELL